MSAAGFDLDRAGFTDFKISVFIDLESDTESDNDIGDDNEKTTSMMHKKKMRGNYPNTY